MEAVHPLQNGDDEGSAAPDDAVAEFLGDHLAVFVPYLIVASDGAGNDQCFVGGNLAVAGAEQDEKQCHSSCDDVGNVLGHGFLLFLAFVRRSGGTVYAYRVAWITDTVKG